MSIEFEYEFPVFILAKRASLEVRKQIDLDYYDPITLSASGRPNALAVFTDRPAAEQFRDEHAPQHEVFELPTPVAFVLFLKNATALAGAVVFDPFRLGKGAVTSPIDAVIAQHLASPDSGGPATLGG